ncbi:MAG TPA: acyl-CoA dehydrogenase family protein [Candidatus Binatia bacterium]|jgi:alkylation response protein AidB-like acyl-CoA dehydrogenase
MDFGLTADQEQLRDAVRDYFARELPVSFARAMLEDDSGFTHAAWQGLSDLGWIGLAVPEDLGGSGLGLLDLVLAAEEGGRVALPGPWTTTVSLGLPLVLAAADDAQQRALVPEIAGGKRRIACAISEERGLWSSDGIAMRAARDGSSLVLRGTKLFVPDAGEADTLIVVAQLDSGLGVFAMPTDMPGIAVAPMQTIDRTRRLFTLDFDNVRLEAGCLLGGDAQDPALLDSVIDRAKVTMAAGMVGAADRALAMTVEYVGIREQFGRAIATFQAIQHRCADMKVAVEHARSLVYYAAWACDTGAADRRLAAAMAKAFASDACPRVAADAVQLHGGIGFTWEHDLHIYFKRLKADEQTYGDATLNRELVARLLEEAA